MDYEKYKEDVYKFYVVQGQNKSIISRRLNITRDAVSKIIKDNKYVQTKKVRCISPHIEKIIAENKETIINMLSSNVDCTEIAKSIGVTISVFKTLAYHDSDIKKALELKNERMHTAAVNRRKHHMDKSNRKYEIVDFEDEE